MPPSERPAALAEAFATAHAVTDEGLRAMALARLAPHLPSERRPAALADALAALRAIGKGKMICVPLLVGLAPHLPPGLLREALATTCIIVEEGTCAEALAGLAPHLPPALLAEALHLLLETCARLPRPEAITQLVHAVTEIGIQRLGGEATVRELVAAIVEVGRRWP